MDEITNNNNLYSTASAFSSNISTSFNDGLAKSILKMVDDTDTLYMSDIIKRFGSYPQVHSQVKRLILDNKLVLYESIPGSIIGQDYDNLKIEKVDQSLSQWLDMAAQPCLTCGFVSECSINNPVSPATCDEFETWLQEEIELELNL